MTPTPPCLHGRASVAAPGSTGPGQVIPTQGEPPWDGPGRAGSVLPAGAGALSTSLLSLMWEGPAS